VRRLYFQNQAACIARALRENVVMNAHTTMQAGRERFGTLTGRKAAVRLALSLLLLNELLSFTSWWPTVGVLPDARIAPEFVALVALLSVWMACRGALPAWVFTPLSAVYALLILGRYVDVVAPSLFGRPISLYWDVPQLPRFLWVTATGSPLWIVILGVAGVAAAVWGFVALLRALWKTLAQALLGLSRLKTFWAVLAPIMALVAANYAGVRATWPYVSKPVIPTYGHEIGLIWDARSPQRLAQLMPARTVIDEALSRPAKSALAALSGRDLTLFFLESFGAVLYDDPQALAAVSATREDLARAIAASGRTVVSAFYRSPTIGGASDLAHLSLLSGIDLSDPRRYQLLITTKRPTLIQVFQQAGYEVWGVYPSVFWDWVERSYYRFNVYLSGPDLDYRGPPFGFWKIPDQYAMAKLEQAHPRTGAAAPRMTIFATMSTHFPFVPTPPYQPDWTRVLSDEPFDAPAVQKAQSEQVDWTRMRPGYLSTVNYAHTWLAGYFARPEPRETVYVLLGDHQPTTNVAGEGARWDVPVYVVARDDKLLARFRQLGFAQGLQPGPKPLGGLHDLTATLLAGFGADGADGPRAQR
jgi:hypothetical protein